MQTRKNRTNDSYDKVKTCKHFDGDMKTSNFEKEFPIICELITLSIEMMLSPKSI